MSGTTNFLLLGSRWYRPACVVSLLLATPLIAGPLPQDAPGPVPVAQRWHEPSDEEAAYYRIWLDAISPGIEDWPRGAAYHDWFDWNGLNPYEPDIDLYPEGAGAFLPTLFWRWPGLALRFVCDLRDREEPTPACAPEVVLKVSDTPLGTSSSLLLADYVWLHGVPGRAVECALMIPFSYEFMPNARYMPLPQLTAWSPVRGCRNDFDYPLASYGSSVLFGESLPLLWVSRAMQGRSVCTLRPAAEPIALELADAYQTWRVVEPYIWPKMLRLPTEAFDLVRACEGEEIERVPWGDERVERSLTVEEATRRLASAPLPEAKRILRGIAALGHRGRAFLRLLADVAEAKPKLAAEAAHAAASILIESPDARRYRSLARRLLKQLFRRVETGAPMLRGREAEDAAVLARFLEPAEAVQYLDKWWQFFSGPSYTGDDELLPCLPELVLFRVLLDRAAPEAIDREFAAELVDDLQYDSRVAFLLLDPFAVPWVERDPTLLVRINTLVAVRLVGRLAPKHAWARQYLVKALRDARSSVRVEAVLQVLAHDAQWPGWSRLFAKRLVAEQNPRVRLVLRDALERVGTAADARYLAAVLATREDLPPSTICSLLHAIAVIPQGPDAVVEVLAENVCAEEPMVAVAATHALGHTAVETLAACDPLRRAAADPRWPVRAAAAEAIGRRGDGRLIETWKELLADPVPVVRLSAARAARGFSRDPQARAEAARALASALRSNPRDVLQFTSPRALFQLAAFRSLAKLGLTDESIAKVIADAAADTSAPVAGVAADAFAATVPEKLASRFAELLAERAEKQQNLEEITCASYAPFEIQAILKLAQHRGVPVDRLGQWKRTAQAVRRLLAQDRPDPSKTREALAKLLSSDVPKVLAEAVRQLSDPAAEVDWTELLKALEKPAVRTRQSAASVIWHRVSMGQELPAIAVAELRNRLAVEQDLTTRVLLAAALCVAARDAQPCVELVPRVYEVGSSHQMWVLLTALPKAAKAELPPSLRTVIAELTQHPHMRLATAAKALLSKNPEAWDSRP